MVIHKAEKCNINKDSLMAYKFNGLKGKYEAKSSRDKILQRLDLLNELLDLYTSKKYNEFLKRTHVSINNNNDKRILKETIHSILDDDSITIGNVLEISKNQGLIKEDDLFDD